MWITCTFCATDPSPPERYGEQVNGIAEQVNLKFRRKNEFFFKRANSVNKIPTPVNSHPRLIANNDLIVTTIT